MVSDNPRRIALEKEVANKKRHLWGNREKFNATRSRMYTIVDANGNIPKTRLLEWFLTADREEIEEKLKAPQNDDYSFLFYR
jgi:hypothetical protein